MTVVALLDLLIIALPVVGLSGLGQTPSARLSGTALDQVGRLLPYVTVALTNRGSMAHREARTDQMGHFEIEGLAAGSYVLEVERSGFTTLQESLTLSAGEHLHQDITLGVAPFEERVIVTNAVTNEVTDGDAPRVTDLGDESSDTSHNGTGAAKCETSAIGGELLPPIKIRDAQPEYPRRLRDAGIKGSVVLAGRISTDGLLKDVRVLTAAHPDLATASVAAIEQWRWTVSRLDCVPIEASLTVTVDFRLRP